MIKKKRKSSSSSGLMIGLAALILVGGGSAFAFFSMPSRNPDAPSNEKIAEGVAFVKELENKSTESVQASFKEERIKAALEEMESEDFNVWAHFGNIVMMGDSRTKEYAHSEFVESRRVMAEDGDTILNITEYLDTLQDLHPDFIIMQYGVNDMENYDVWPTVDIYWDAFKQRIDRVQEVLPDSTIFVQSILPCIEPELSRLACRREIPAWNEALRGYCDEAGIPLIDVTALAEQYDSYYEPDGMHFIASFYPFWAKKLLSEVVTYEN